MSASDVPEKLSPDFDYDEIEIKGLKIKVVKDFDMRYKNIKTLGHGFYGSVDLVQDLLRKEEVAIKSINVGLPRMIEEIKMTLGEVLTLQRINERNDNVESRMRIDIPKYYDVFLRKNPNDPSRYQICIVMEYIIGSTLEILHKIYRIKTNFETNQFVAEHDNLLRRFVPWLFRNLSNFHRLGLVHRDLKMENIIVRHRPIKDDQTDFVLIDMGFACSFPGSQFIKPDEEIHYDSIGLSSSRIKCIPRIMGSLGYMAPEYYYHTYKLSSLKASDVWAAGIITWEMCNLKLWTSELLSRIGGSLSDDMVETMKQIRSVLDLPVTTRYHPPFDRVILESMKKDFETRVTASDVDAYLTIWKKGIYVNRIGFNSFDFNVTLQPLDGDYFGKSRPPEMFRKLVDD